MRVELEREERKSQVFQVMPEDYYQKFKVITAETLAEVERELKMNDFLQVRHLWSSVPDRGGGGRVCCKLCIFLCCWHVYKENRHVGRPPGYPQNTDGSQVELTKISLGCAQRIPQRLANGHFKIELFLKKIAHNPGVKVGILNTTVARPANTPSPPGPMASCHPPPP